MFYIHCLFKFKLEKGVVVYIDSGPNWSPFGKPRIRRPLSSVILDEGSLNSYI